jgi:hypothetical protein
MRLLALAFVLLSACSAGDGSQAGASPPGSPTPSPLAAASGRLHAQVPMPVSFPPDVPIYPGARLTAAAPFTSSGQATWSMEWETLDAVTKVRAFYADKMNQADWKISFANTSTNAFKATFGRRSDSRVTGTLASNDDSGYTKILMSLVALSG